MFQEKLRALIEKKTPPTEKNLLYKMAQPLFRAPGAHFEFYAFQTVFSVFRAFFGLKTTFWSLLTGLSSILLSDSSSEKKFVLESM